MTRSPVGATAEPPSSGRSYETTRPVRLSDVTPKGRARLDAVARYLQDIGNDDAVDAIGEEAAAWVVRRTTLHVERFPVFREDLKLTTWASGVGSRWAERSTAIVGNDGGAIHATALWVHVDLQTGRPKRLPPDFDEVYGEAAGGREVSARLGHDDPPAAARPVPWPARFTDFDVLGHVNNAVYWAVVEEHLDVKAPVVVVLEYRGGIDRGQAAGVVVEGDSLWIVADGTVAASARIIADGV
jgi:acyl-ACP thioesterase